MKRLFLILTTALAFSALAVAGEISGKIYRKDGSPCSNCKVSASISWSGMTKKVYTDKKGQFTLKWSSNNSIDKLFVNGETVRRNIKDGEYVVIRLD